jgi:hypothetical protein
LVLGDELAIFVVIEAGKGCGKVFQTA